MHPDEDYAYETQRQRRLDESWSDAEDQAATELSFRRPQKLRKVEHETVLQNYREIQGQSRKS